MTLHKFLYSYQWPFRWLRHLAYWCFWLGFYGIVNSQYHGTEFYKWFLFELYTMIVKIPFAYVLAYYVFPRYIPQRKYVQLILVVLSLALAGLVVLMYLYQLFPYAMPNGVGGFSTPKTLYMYTDLLYIASPVVLIKIIQQYIQQQKKTADLRQEKMESELKVLKNQLQPHFLFNNLNNIYSMVTTGDKRAADSLLRLSDLLSYMLYECNTDLVPVYQEVALLRNYLELEKLRYGNRLEVSFQEHLTSETIMIAPLLFLPFVENAFKHGVAKHPGSGFWIRIILENDDHELVFMIENNCTGSEIQEKPGALKSGIGLHNIHRRMDLLYPEKHEIILMKEDTFLVKLRIKI